MFSALFTFLGGTAFRLIFGEVVAFFNKAQDHKYEVERLKLQGEMDAAASARQLEAIRVQADLGVQTIRVQGEQAVAKAEADAFLEAVKLTGEKSGFWVIDAWNSAIRPLMATEVLILITLYYHSVGWQLDNRGWELAGAILGLFVADRSLFRRGK